MQLGVPSLTFPKGFCCNCGAVNCLNELQDTRVTRYFGIGGSETTFQLPLPICAGCRRSTRRRPPGLFARLLVLGIMVSVLFLGLVVLASYVAVPLFIGEHLFAIGAGLGFIAWIVFYRLRRAHAPRTSFYQPVRIKDVSVQVVDVMNGVGDVVYMKLAFTNPDYLNMFATANRDAIAARRITAVRA